jgi:hypothetical protein
MQRATDALSRRATAGSARHACRYCWQKRQWQTAPCIGPLTATGRRYGIPFMTCHCIPAGFVPRAIN